VCAIGIQAEARMGVELRVASAALLDDLATHRVDPEEEVTQDESPVDDWLEIPLGDGLYHGPACGLILHNYARSTAQPFFWTAGAAMSLGAVLGAGAPSIVEEVGVRGELAVRGATFVRGDYEVEP